MIKKLDEIKELHEQADQAYDENDFEKMCQILETLFLEEYTDWLIEQAEKVEKYKKAIETFKRETDF